MKNTVYDVPSDIVTGTSQFKLTFNETGQITTLWNPGDPDAMNWIHGRTGGEHLAQSCAIRNYQ